MKTQLLTLFTFTLISISANANYTGRILHIDAPDKMGDAYEVLTSGSNKILKVNPNSSELIENLYDAQGLDTLVDLQLKNDELTEIEPTEIDEALTEENTEEYLHPMTNYTPSNVDSIDTAQELFNSLWKRTKWFTQCFNRAHVWAKQMYDSHEVKSMKILIYYTKKYRREISGKWWFHIAPMVNVNGERYVLDKEFTRGPVTDSDWEKIFTKKMERKGIHGYRCKVIENISEYYDDYNQNNEYCNIQVTSMYYWEPNDMSRLEKTGEQQLEFQNRDLRIAAREIFWKWRGKYNRIKD